MPKHTGQKNCRNCHQTKPIDDFKASPDSKAVGRLCHACRKEQKQLAHAREQLRYANFG